MKQIISFILVLSIISYLSLWLFWSFFSFNKASAAGVDLHFHGKLSKKEISRLIENTTKHLKTSELYRKENLGRNFSVYLSSNHLEYALLMLQAYRSFGVSLLPWIQRIIIAPSNLSENKVFRNGKSFNMRSLDSVIAHEITHVLMERQLGFIKNRFLPGWKAEGYADYVAGESSFDPVLGKETFCQGESDKPISYKYFKWRMLITYLIEVEGRSFQEIANQKIDRNEIEKKACHFICRKGSS